MKRFKAGKTYLVFMLVLSGFLITGCGNWEGGGGTSGPGAPGAPGSIIPGAICTVASGPLIPTVISSNPTSGNLNVTTSTTDVAPQKKIIATFSMPMDPLTIQELVGTTALSTFSLKEKVSGNNVAGTVAMNIDNIVNTIATFTTTGGALTDNMEYTVTITTAAKSATNVAMACRYEWDFKTITPPATGLAAINPGLLDPFAIASFNSINDTGFTNVNGDAVIDTGLNCNGIAVGVTDDFGPGCNVGANTITNNAGDRVITQATLPAGEADAIMVELNTKWISISPAGTPGATDLGCGVIGTLGGAGAGIGCNLNATLPPGAYIAAIDSITITGDLTLDAGGNPDAVWVFQTKTPSTINASVGSQIILTGGAKASNVWWYVGSSSTLLTNSVFNGNILASASITMQNGATSCGRLLSGAEGTGAFVFDNNVVSVPGHPNAPPGCQ